MLEIKNLTKSFNGNIILNNLNLKIFTNSIIGIYGESGIGKSTLAKILVGIYHKDEGEIFLDGKNLYKKDKYLRKIGKDIQLVYQETYLPFDKNKVTEKGIKEVFNLSKLYKRKEYKVVLSSLMEKLELDSSILKKYPHQLSGGEAKRVLILKALLLKPKVLILDESTVMLDKITEAQIAKIIKELAKELIVIWISHDYDLLKFVANKIYKLENGNLEVKK